jgi:hypothetical protein
MDEGIEAQRGCAAGLRSHSISVGTELLASLPWEPWFSELKQFKCHMMYAITECSQGMFKGWWEAEEGCLTQPEGVGKWLLWRRW